MEYRSLQLFGSGTAIGIMGIKSFNIYHPEDMWGLVFGILFMVHPVVVGLQKIRSNYISIIFVTGV
jgi:hypothetical protein